MTKLEELGTCGCCIDEISVRIFVTGETKAVKLFRFRINIGVQMRARDICSNNITGEHCETI